VHFHLAIPFSEMDFLRPVELEVQYKYSKFTQGATPFIIYNIIFLVRDSPQNYCMVSCHGGMFLRFQSSESLSLIFILFQRVPVTPPRQSISIADSYNSNSNSCLPGKYFASNPSTPTKSRRPAMGPLFQLSVAITHDLAAVSDSENERSVVRKLGTSGHILHVYILISTVTTDFGTPHFTCHGEHLASGLVQLQKVTSECFDD
jgi:hypothetical protein